MSGAAAWCRAEDRALLDRWYCAALVATYQPWLQPGRAVSAWERRIAEHRVGRARAGLALLTDTAPMPAIDAAPREAVGVWSHG